MATACSIYSGRHHHRKALTTRGVDSVRAGAPDSLRDVLCVQVRAYLAPPVKQAPGAIENEAKSGLEKCYSFASKSVVD